MSVGTVAVLVLSFALLLSIALLLATGVKRLQQISGWVLAPAAAIGLIFYSTGYLTDGTAGDVVLSCFRAVYATGLMFMGRNDFAGLVRSAEWFANSTALQIVFWTAHLGAFFVAASALLSTLGKKAIQTLRLRLSRAKNLYLIYGLNEQSILLGRDLKKQESSLVVYISPKAPPDLLEQAVASGGTVRQEPYLPGGALNTRLLAYLGFSPGRKRNLYILALDENESTNVRLLQRMFAFLTERHIPPERVRSFLRTRGEFSSQQVELLQEENPSLYPIESFCEAELAARLLIKEAPPYRTMEFDDTGMAKGDFGALILGFGQVGQQVLRQLVMNGQFPGSKFCVHVVDRAANSISGQFKRRYRGMLDEYDIRFHTPDMRSDEFYRFLDEHIASIRYIAICLGTDERNYEAASDLERYFLKFDDDKRPTVVTTVLDKRHVTRSDGHIRFFERRERVFSAKILLRDGLDEMAQAVNFTYAKGRGADETPESAWRALPHFSRESSRASADFIPAMLKMAGIDMASAKHSETFFAHLSAELTETLSIAEHLRWNAFHYAAGYTPMAPDDARRRKERGLVPVQKDTLHLKHVCLVPWEELDSVSALITELQGAPVNYKSYDRQNVLNIPITLSILENTQ
ncbi:hypothetical protein LJC34_00475 [Oscillospiraceae bacterium OttesenSCG-928-G22]|nr:hypothetical protein [Oscillospiraceae bacterium OttesenSCG-928-G22]